MQSFNHSFNLLSSIGKGNIPHLQLLNRKVCPNPGIVPSKQINTQGSQRKGKLSAVRKREVQSQLTDNESYSKSVGDSIKQFNFENKQMFGNLLNAVRGTCQNIKAQTFIKKPDKKDFKKPAFVDLTYNESCVPIQDVMAFSTSDSSGTVSSIESTNRMANSILKFPLMDKVDKTHAEELTKELNHLRQWLEEISQGKPPSVTSILESTMPPEQALTLKNWKKSMIEKMGEEGFEKYQKELFFNGSSLHQTINGYLSRIPEMKAEVLPANAGHWTSLSSVLKDIQEVKLLEERVTHPFLHYRGVVDCLGMYKNHLVVVDWKTSKKPKLSLQSTYSNPLQIAAYVGALNFDPKFKYMVNSGLLVVAYENGTPATVHHMTESILLTYWQKWLDRLKTYYEKMPSS